MRRALPDDGEWRALRYQAFGLPRDAGRFAERAARIDAIAREVAWPQPVTVVQQPVADRAALRRKLDEVVRGGGKGLVLHGADALWRSGRSEVLLQRKRLQDAAALVAGHVPGRGKYGGQIGALRVRLDNGTEFLIGTGFSGAERASPPPAGVYLTSSYRGTTAAGVPRFASFLHVREL